MSANEPRTEGSSPPGPGVPRPDPALDKPQAPDRTFLNRAATVAVLAVVGIACAYLLTPGLFSQRIPYGDDSLGQISNTVIKATRDYEIRDEESTGRKRKEASDSVLPIYDYDLSIGEAAVERVRSAFGYMREASRDAEVRLKLRDPDGRLDEAKRRPLRKDELEVLLRVYAEHREEWERRLETHLDDESFRALAEARFSEEIQREAERLVARAMGEKIAEDRERLALTSGRGIVVRRRTWAGVVGENVLSDISGVRDQAEVRQDAERWAAELPAEMPVGLRRAVATLASREVRANLRINSAETAESRKSALDSVKTVFIPLKKGEKIIGDGERIERRHLVIFKAIAEQAKIEESIFARVGGGLFAVVIVVVVYGFARSSLRRFRPTRKDALLGAVTMVGMLGLVNLSITVSSKLREGFFPQLPNEILNYAVPFAAGAMLIRFVLSTEASIVFAVVFAALSGILAGNSLEFALYALLGSLVASAQVARAKDRAAIFRAGFYTGLANAVAVVCFGLLSSKPGALDIAAGSLAGFIGGALSVPIVVMTVTPLVEGAFGYTTDVKLLELANLNHPALKELIVQAPGTYHHSIIIGSLVEAAAEAIGANPLLARVCAYYHDIGKGKNPLYFGENQRGENRHDKLAPQMSALIVKRHVTDGMEMARQYKLPKQVADAIPQHHGTRLVGYFFHKALKEQEGKVDAVPVEESLYRYPGPKPQTREAALVMIADAVEASSRAMAEPNPAKLQALVQKIINGIFVDGQLDECDLTLRDLNEIARSFYRTLGGIYHTRPDYPAQAMGGGRPALAEVKDGKPVEMPKLEPISDLKRVQGGGS